ncbi:MAG: DNA alkylation repair protein [Methanomicrobiaceae archaeon]|nr:DNA alkylation repair protein [Methanomicrobiaceae archaeon]
MISEDVIAGIRRDLAARADEKTRDGAGLFFKEEVHFHGVKSGAVRAIAREYFPRGWEKAAVWSLCEELLRSGYLEESGIACDWAERLKQAFEPEDFAVFERWLHTYVSNWAVCDSLCNHAVGSFLEMYPGYLPRLEVWARSENRWVRRGAAVSLVLPARKGMFLAEVVAIADLLLTDPDDLVQKGYGWMLKEAGRAHPDEVFSFVMARRQQMPRTALRAAVEKFPADRRAQATAKDAGRG